MKRSLIIAAAAAVIAGVCTFWLMHLRSEDCTCGGRALNRDNISFLAEKLDLTVEQAEKIETMFAGLEAQIEDSCARHCAARANLANIISGDAQFKDQEDRMVSELVKAYEESERAALENMRKVRALLEPGQKDKFDKLISECICKSCAGCGMRDSDSGAGK